MNFKTCWNRKKSACTAVVENTVKGNKCDLCDPYSDKDLYTEMLPDQLQSSWKFQGRIF